MMTNVDLIVPIHPGDILWKDSFAGLGITQNRLAVAIDTITIDTTERLQTA